MKSIRTQAAVIAAIAALGFAGTVAAAEGSPVKSRIYLEGQNWTGSGAPDSAFTQAGALKSRSFETAANDTIGGPTPTKSTQVVRTVSWDNAPAWVAREGAPTVAPVSQNVGSKHASK